MMQLKKSISNWKKWIFFRKKIIAVWLLLILVFLLLASATSIKKVYCYCDGQTCEESLCQMAKQLVGNNILTLNKNRVINKLNSTGKYQKIAINVSAPTILNLNFHSTSDFLVFNSTITSEKPKLSMDSPPISSDSAIVFNKPSSEILDWINKYQTLSIKVFPGGQYEITSTTSSQIYAITQEKKDISWYKSAFELIKLVLAYSDVSGIYFLDNNVYFAQVGQPDIITSIEYEEAKLLKSLQSVRFLTTIKKDPKIIDLRYTNPIIR